MCREIQPGHIRGDAKKVAAQCGSRVDIRRLLGVFNLCGKTCPGLGRLVKPMQDALKDKQLIKGE